MLRTMQRKKQTPAEQARQIKLMGDVARRVTRDNHIVFIAGITPRVVVINRATGKEKKLDMVQAVAVSDSALVWRISLWALCRNEQGFEYIKGEHLSLERPVRQRDIHQALNQRHMEFMRREVNRKHLLTLAWSATTGDEPSEAEADRMFTKLKAWEQLDVATEQPEGAMLINASMPEELIVEAMA